MSLRPWKLFLAIVAVLATSAPRRVDAQGAPTVEVGRIRLDSLLRRGRADPGRRASAPEIHRTLDRGFGNPFLAILRIADSLRLSNDLQDSISWIQYQYRMAVDSAWTPLSASLAALPVTYNLDSVWVQVQATHAVVANRLISVAPSVLAMLTPLQQQTLTGGAKPAE